METTYHDCCTDTPSAYGELAPVAGEFPKPRPFDMRLGRYDVRSYDRNLSKYQAQCTQRRRASCRRFLDSRIGGVRLRAFANPLLFVVMAVLVVTGGLSLAGWAATGGAISAAAPFQALGGDGLQPTSTPVAQWERGSIPFLFQTDPAWADQRYAGAAEEGQPGSIGTHGCGPTCLSMVYAGLTGRKDMAPPEMCAFAEAGGYVDAGLTSWTLMSEGARELGLRSQELPASAEVLRHELEAGHPVICSVGPGDFTTQGHFIVLAGLSENGRLVVHDPNSPKRSAETWETERVLSQCRNLWSFSA